MSRTRDHGCLEPGGLSAARLAFVFLVLAVGACLVAGDAARADDGWNPFAERDENRNRSKRAVPLPPPGSSPGELPPMGGVSSRPWADAPGPGLPPRPLPDAAGAVEITPWGGATPVGPHAATPAGNAAPPAYRPNTRPLTGPGADQSQPGVVERAELTAPLVARDGSRLPQDLWGGLAPAAAQELIAQAHVPPHSAALHVLWRRLWNSPSIGQSGAGTSGLTYAAMRLEALYRSGLVADLRQAIAPEGSNGAPAGDQGDVVLGLLTARSHLALGERDIGCAGVKGIYRNQAALPKPLRADLLLLAGLCGAGGGDAGAAGLAAELLRAESVDAPVALAVLDALSGGTKRPPHHTKAQRTSLVDYRYRELVHWETTPDLLAGAEPALLSVLATTATSPDVRIAAAEAAARFGALTAKELADAYRAYPSSPAARTEPQGQHTPEQAAARAILFRAAEAERTPIKKARLVRSLMDAARRAGLYPQVAAMLAETTATMLPAPEISWFSETAIEISLASGSYDRVPLWAEPARGESQGGSQHWLVLADIADPKWRGRRGATLVHAEQMALHGRFSPTFMHRLVTVLDALDYQIPIPLWEAASRSPQPSGGHLPATGILSQLQDASKKKEVARTVLLAMRTLGPDSGDTAHMIALGDAIRALRRAGLEREARQLGLEALFLDWPRTASQ